MIFASGMKRRRLSHGERPTRSHIRQKGMMARIVPMSQNVWKP
jgi:hypothetical protein